MWKENEYFLCMSRCITSELWGCLQNFSCQTEVCSEFTVLLMDLMGSVGLEFSKAVKYILQPIPLQWSIWGQTGTLLFIRLMSQHLEFQASLIWFIFLNLLSIPKIFFPNIISWKLRLSAGNEPRENWEA